MKRITKALLVAGALCAIATIAIVVLLVPFWLALSMPALLGMVLAEVVLFGGLALLEENAGRFDSIVGRIGCTTVLAICCVAEFTLSLICMGMPAVISPWYGAIQIAIALVLICGCGTFVLIGGHVKSVDAAMTLLVAQNLSRADRVERMAARCADKAQEETLHRIAEDLRFSDSAISMSIDEQIDACIVGVEATLSREDLQTQTANREIAHLRGLVEERKQQVALTRRGGF